MTSGMYLSSDDDETKEQIPVHCLILAIGSEKLLLMVRPKFL